MATLDQWISKTPPPAPMTLGANSVQDTCLINKLTTGCLIPTKLSRRRLFKLYQEFAEDIEDMELLNDLASELSGIINDAVNFNDIIQSPSSGLPCYIVCGTPPFDEKGEPTEDFYSRLDWDEERELWLEGDCSCGYISEISYKDFLKAITDPYARTSFTTDAGPFLIPKFNEIWKAKTFNERFMAFDRVITTIHGRGELARIFIEGGTDTLREISSIAGLPRYRRW